VIVVPVDQRTPEWFAARRGRVTGSRASDMLATIRSGEAAGRRNLRIQLVLERVTGQTHERNPQTWAMQQGVETEAQAYAAYEALTGTLLSSSGFIQHDELMAGCSLDGHTPDFEWQVEIKCPYSATHLETLRTGKVPGDYLKQITHGIWLTGAQWCDFMSFDPSFPEPLRAKVIRVERASLDLAHHEAEVRRFLAEVDAEEAELRRMVEQAA
jgi:putative phage-type endonuclease